MLRVTPRGRYKVFRDKVILNPYLPYGSAVIISGSAKIKPLGLDLDVAPLKNLRFGFMQDVKATRELVAKTESKEVTFPSDWPANESAEVIETRKKKTTLKIIHEIILLAQKHYYYMIKKKLLQVVSKKQMQRSQIHLKIQTVIFIMVQRM